MRCSLKESRIPRFPMTICDRTFELAKTHLQSLNYNGPVCLSCDDTKLFSALWLYWDEQEQSHFLIGSTLGPLRVTDVDNMKAVLDKARETKATKVCILNLNSVPVRPFANRIALAAMFVVYMHVIGAKNLPTHPCRIAHS